MTTISAPDPKRLLLVFKLPNPSSSSSYSSSSSSSSTRTAESKLLPQWSRKRKRSGGGGRGEAVSGSDDNDNDNDDEMEAAGGLLMLTSGAAADNNNRRRGLPFSPKSSNAVSIASANGPTTVEDRLQSRIDRVLGGDGPLLKEHKGAEAPRALKKRCLWEVCNMALASSQSLAGPGAHHAHSHCRRRTQHCSSSLKALPFDLNELPAVI